MGNQMKRVALILVAVLMISGFIIPDISYANTNYVTATKTVNPSVITTEEEATVTLSIQGTPPVGVIRPNDVILIIDRSGSMAASYNQGDDFMLAAKNASKGFVDLMDMSKHQVGVVDFSTDIKSFPLSTDKTAVKNYITPLVASGSTATGAAIYKAKELLENKRTDAQPVIVLLTDGDATVPSQNPYAYAMQAATDAKDAGIVFYTIALLQQSANPDTSGPNKLMKDMATTSQHHHFVLGSTGLDQIYARIVQEIGRASAYNVVVTDTVAPEFELVPDSYMDNIPRPTVVGNQLRWEFLELKDETLTFTYKIRHKAGSPIGSLPVASGSNIAYLDYAGAQRSLNINNPTIQVKHPAPIITSIVEDNGHIAGGNTVTIHGGKFRTGVTVSFGTKAATNVQLISSQEIRATVPSGTQGSTVVVTVKNTDNQTATTNYRYWAEPIVTSYDPKVGPFEGGTIVMFNGNYFLSGLKVKFGDQYATTVHLYNPTKFYAVTPRATASGPVDILIENLDGTKLLIPNGFTYGPAPVTSPEITSITPNKGLITGGDTVTINGKNFATNSKVFIGAIEVPINSFVNATQIKVKIPQVSTPGTVDVKIINTDGQEGILANGYTYEALPLPPAPTITAINPASAIITGGINSTITGTNISQDAKVYLGAVETPINLYTSSASVRIAVPAVTTPGKVNVKIVNPDGQEVVLVDGFTYEPIPLPPAPTITAINPATAIITGGINATITGANINQNAKVYFGGIEAPINLYTSSSSIRVTVPAATTPGKVNVKIVNVDGQEAELVEGFTYEPVPLPPAPTITAISPNTDLITGGKLVIIDGTNLNQNAKVFFGDIEVPLNLYYSALKVRVKAPATTVPGPVNVRIVNPDGQAATMLNGFTYEPLPLAPAPTITNISPNTDLITGGKLVIIDGTNFNQNAKVFFGDIEVPINLYYSALKVRVKAPATTVPGPINVRIVNPDGQEATFLNGFTYEALPPKPAPTITKISPNSDLIVGGALAIIDGTNIDQNAKIFFGDVEVPINLYYSALKVRVRVPATTAPGAVDITIRNEDGQTATLPSGFNYVLPIPTITSVADNSGPMAGGTLILINGTNFEVNASATVGGVPSQVTFVNSGYIRVKTPEYTGDKTVNQTVPVIITNPSTGLTVSTQFTYIAPPAVPAPTITNITTNAAKTLLYIDGTDMHQNVEIDFGGVIIKPNLYYSKIRIRAAIPTNTPKGEITVRVINPDGQVSNSFIYVH